MSVASLKENIQNQHFLTHSYQIIELTVYKNKLRAQVILRATIICLIMGEKEGQIAKGISTELDRPH